MTFEETFELDLGTVVLVSDGAPPPPGAFGSVRYNQWRSHNFGGEIISKTGEAPYRVLRISDLGNTYNVTYDVVEWVPHTFSLP